MSGVWISAGFGRTVGQASLQWLKSLGVSGIRTDIPWGAPLQYRERLLAELGELGMGGILIVGGNMEYRNGGEIKKFPRDWRPNTNDIASYAREIALQAAGYPQSKFYLELGNEPNLENHGGPLAREPERWGRWIQHVPHHVWETLPDTEIIAGGICFLNAKSLRYLERAFRSNPGIDSRLIIGLHPYRTDKRADEDTGDLKALLERFREIIGPRSYAITEIGWHSAPQKTESILPCKRKEFRFSDEDVADFAEWELDFWQRNGAKLVNWYQLNCGENEFNPEDNYGIRDIDGRAKPVADAIRRYARGAPT